MQKLLASSQSITPSASSSTSQIVRATSDGFIECPRKFNSANNCRLQ